MPFPLIPLLVGAGIGAATSDDPLKGALKGAAVGGLGAGLLASTGGAAALTGGTEALAPMTAEQLTGPVLQSPLMGASTELAAAPGFKEKLTMGLLTNADKFIPQEQPSPQAPAGTLQRGQFNPSGNLFMQFQRRRR